MNFFRTHCFLILLMCFFCLEVVAQTERLDYGGSKTVSGEFSAAVDVIDEVTLLGAQGKIKLWGVKKINWDSPVLDIRARTALEMLVIGQDVVCAPKSNDSGFVRAQCVNAKEEDLGLFLLHSGLVSLNRAEVYGTIYEAPYAKAEELAQSLEKGVWASSDLLRGGDDSIAQGRDFMRGAFLLVCTFLIAIVLVSIYIMRGFGRVVSLQNQSIDLAVKERDLREREKNVIVSMIHAEIRENKPKIDAYLTVYDEMLREISQGHTPQFMKTGEVVQKQPALNRCVFDGNTGKLDRLGVRVASDIIHYYARIKTAPDYIEIKPEMSRDEVREVIQDCVDYAGKLDSISANLLETFCNIHLIEDA